MLQPITLHPAALDMSAATTPEHGRIVTLRLYTHDHQGTFDVPMTAAHAAALGSALSDYAADAVPCW